jgi:hypothetical protein
MMQVASDADFLLDRSSSQKREETHSFLLTIRGLYRVISKKTEIAIPTSLRTSTPIRFALAVSLVVWVL